MYKKNNVKPEWKKHDDHNMKMIYKATGTNDINELELLSNRKIEQFLNEKLPRTNTREVLFYTLKKHFMIKHWDKNRMTTLKNRDVAFWAKEAKIKTIELEESERKNLLDETENENWKNYDEIMKIRDEIKNKDSNKYLLLSMCLLQPPLRNDFYATVKFCTKKSELNDTDNFLYLNTKTKKCMYIVNKDKVSEKSTIYKMKENKEIPIESDELNKILFESYNKNNRTYVFTTNGGDRYTNDTIRECLLKRPFKLNFDTLRSAYITKYHNENKSYDAKVKLAQKMRHDVKTAQIKYFKDEDKFEKNQQEEEAPQVNITLESILTKLTEEEKQFLENYINDLKK